MLGCMGRKCHPHRETALTMLKEGKTAHNVAQEVGVSATSVYNWAHAANMPVPPDIPQPKFKGDRRLRTAGREAPGEERAFPGTGQGVVREVIHTVVREQRLPWR